jgi:hypothetical protein
MPATRIVSTKVSKWTLFCNPVFSHASCQGCVFGAFCCALLPPTAPGLPPPLTLAFVQHSIFLAPNGCHVPLVSSLTLQSALRRLALFSPPFVAACLLRPGLTAGGVGPSTSPGPPRAGSAALALLALLCVSTSALVHTCVHDSIPEVHVPTVPAPQVYPHVDARGRRLAASSRLPMRLIFNTSAVTSGAPLLNATQKSILINNVVRWHAVLPWSLRV